MKELTCKYCKKIFKVFPYRLQRKDAKIGFCSQKCYHEGFRGTKMSDKIKRKMSLSHGKPIWLDGQIPWNRGVRGICKAWNKGIKCPQFSGKNHPNWQGGKTPEIRKIRNSLEIKLWRLEVFKRDGYFCQKCFKRGGVLHCHHIENFSQNIELRFESNNGITLCKKCHEEFHKVHGKKNNNLKQLLKFIYESTNNG